MKYIIHRRALEPRVEDDRDHYGNKRLILLVRGLVKNLALVIYTRVGSNANSSLEILDEWGTKNFEEFSTVVILQATKILVNGLCMGIHRVELDVDGMDKNNLLKLADASCADVNASCADADANAC
ncbi:RNA polymerase II second largest subunit [Tanacetum coccineum]